jgi:hypothetical protein
MRYFQRLPVLLFVISWPVVPVRAQKIEAKVLGREIIEQRLQVSGKNPERRARLFQMFLDAGCPEPQLKNEPVDGTRLPNVVGTLPGDTESLIIVGAHYDADFSFGRGVIDNWSGASLLPSLFESIRAYPRKHTFVFMGFAGEEQGLIGSRDFVHKLSKTRRATIDGMVNMDCIGMTSTKVEPGTTGTQLTGILIGVAKLMKVPMSIVDVSRVGMSDSNAFAEAKIPAVTIHSITQDNLSVLHDLRDRDNLIRIQDYYETYRLVAFYLAALDALLPQKRP